MEFVCLSCILSPASWVLRPTTVVYFYYLKMIFPKLELVQFFCLVNLLNISKLFRFDLYGTGFDLL